MGDLSIAVKDGVLYKNTSFDEYVDIIYYNIKGVSVNTHFNGDYIIMSSAVMYDKIVMNIEIQNSRSVAIRKSVNFYNYELYDLIIELIYMTRNVKKTKDQIPIEYFNKVISRTELLGRHFYYNRNASEDELSNMSLHYPTKRAR